MFGIREYLEACEHRKGFLEEQLAWLNEERENYAADAKQLEDVSARIRQEMVGYLFPEVHDEHIASLEKRLSYPGLLPIKREYDARFDAAEKRRVELEQMDEFQEYDYRIDQATREVEDVRPAYDKVKSRLGAWEKSKWFDKLHQRGYFALDYRAGFFRRFLDWRAVSFLMSDLKKHAGQSFDVPEVLRTHYRNLREEADTVIAAFDKRSAERDRIARVKTEHEETVSAPERLLSEMFRDLGNATLSHLDACPDDLRLELARTDQNLNAFLRKQTGVAKQIQYLRELSVTRIDSRTQQLDQELVKVKNKIQKLQMQQRRGKRKRYSQDDLDRMRNVKAEKWERNRSKTIKMRGKIRDFEKYDRGSCTTDYLWWDLMTGGATADDIYEVREFRQRNPGWDYRSYDDPTTGYDESMESGLYDDAAEDLASSMAADDDAMYDAS